MINTAYLRRIFSAYIIRKNSQLSFWHGIPELDPHAEKGVIGPYYMSFNHKAMYSGPYDNKGIPLLDYHGQIGKQYNPIAIAQFGLGNYNLYKQNNDSLCLEKSIRVADWLVNNLIQNESGLWVWNHLFDWEYFRTLKSPWFSALAQGQGVSLLLRIYLETDILRYKEGAERAFKTMITQIKDGGVLYLDSEDNWWLEEYIVAPPTHILNGFIWALWGVYDYLAITKNETAEELWRQSLKTLKKKLLDFDNGYWSLYDLSQTALSNIASFFYHSLHIVQLRIMTILSGDKYFDEIADQWESYKINSFYRKRAFVHKAIFKVFYF